MDTKNSQTRLFDYPNTDIQRSQFTFSHKNKMGINFGRLFPTMVKETMPGDKWNFRTTFFNRYLTMQAPVFADYNLKFNNFFVANSQIWGGWQQFIADGDDQSSSYLLGQKRPNDNGEVPYTSTENLYYLLFMSLCKSVPNQLRSRVPLEDIDMCIYAVPMVCYSPFYGIADDPQQGINNINDRASLRDLYPNSIFWVPMLMKKSSSFTRDLLDRGLIAPISGEDNLQGYPDMFNAWLISNVVSKTAFYFEGYNPARLDDLYPDEGYTFLPFPHSEGVVVPSPIAYAQGVSNSPEGYYYGGLGGDGMSEFGYNVSDRVTQFLGSGLFYSVTANKHLLTRGGELVDANSARKVAVPVGNLRCLTHSEVNYVDNLQPTVISCVLDYVVDYIFVKMFGAGSLADYMGLNLTHILRRQPDNIADTLLGYVDAEYRREDYHRIDLGTYGQSPELEIEVGVRNNEPLSLLPFLAYHKCWSDLIRDPRFELRFLFSDPYVSPFLTAGWSDEPNKNTYAWGNVSRCECTGPFSALSWSLWRTNLEDLSTVTAEFFTADEQKSRDNALSRRSFWSWWSWRTLFTIRKRRVAKDYFSMFTPQPQYGEESMISANAETNIYSMADAQNLQVDTNGELKTANGSKVVLTSSFSIASLRLASRLQAFMERNNITGSDYLKQILSHYGVKPNICQHCSVVYLGGDKYEATVSPVEMVGADSEKQTTGQQSANMYCSGETDGISFNANEHGYIIQFVTMQNDFITYSGIPKQRIDKFDFAFPIFANLGAEAVPLNRLIFTDNSKPNLAKGTDFNGRLTFGYQPRYAELKCGFDEFHGDFKKSLNYWVTPRRFNPSLKHGTFGLGDVGNVPELGENFLYEEPNYEGFSYTQEDFDHCLLDLEHHISVYRNLPKLPLPTII
jgi:hypothetical protein